MSNRRYSPEFKDEAVRQIIEAGHTVSDVAARLGVSTNSLYKWVGAVQPNTDSLKDDELIESRRENLELRAELRRVEEERDILKKAAGYFARNQG
jgi:transposase